MKSPAISILYVNDNISAIKIQIVFPWRLPARGAASRLHPCPLVSPVPLFTDNLLSLDLPQLLGLLITRKSATFLFTFRPLGSTANMLPPVPASWLQVPVTAAVSVQADRCEDQFKPHPAVGRFLAIVHRSWVVGFPAYPVRVSFFLSHPLPGKGPGRGRPVPQEGEHNGASSKQERKKMLRLSYRQCSTKAEVQSPAITESYTNNNG